jgi:hypothetical protein
MLTIGFDFLMGFSLRDAFWNSFTPFSVMSKTEFAVLFLFIFSLGYHLIFPLFKKMKGNQ